jgi:hypothetical protein
MRMKEYFNANNTSGNMRTMRSLQSRWSVINANCQKWAGVQADVDVLSSNATNDVDMLSCSIVCYFILMCICLLFYMTHFFSFIHYVA